MESLDVVYCPEIVEGPKGDERCNSLAERIGRVELLNTDADVPLAEVHCILGHSLLMPNEELTVMENTVNRNTPTS